MDLWENISFFSSLFFRSLNCFHTPWVLDAKTAVFVWIQRGFLSKRTKEVCFGQRANFLSHPVFKNNVFLNRFPQTICYWSVKQIAPPQTRTTGLATVAMSGWSRCDSDTFTLFQGNQATVQTQYLVVYEFWKKITIPMFTYFLLKLNVCVGNIKGFVSIYLF